MIYGKEYFETYALLSLVYCYDPQLSALIAGDNEAPDWQSEALDVGIEVTQALTPQEGENRFFLSEFFGEDWDGDGQVHEHLRCTTGEALRDYEDSLMCIRAFYESRSSRENVVDAVHEKLRKLNHHYKLFRRNWLYVFSDSALMNGDDLQFIGEGYRALCRQMDLCFGKVFINVIDALVVLRPDGQWESYPVPKETQRKLHWESLERNSRG